jgi:hypothetical protein
MNSPDNCQRFNPGTPSSIRTLSITPSDEHNVLVVLLHIDS